MFLPRKTKKCIAFNQQNFLNFSKQYFVVPVWINDYFRCQGNQFKVTQSELLGYHGYRIAKIFLKIIWFKIYKIMIFLSFFDRYLNSRIMAVAMDPKPNKLEANVMLKFRNLKVRTRLKLVSIALHCVYLFQGNNTHFQVDEREKTCVFWRGFSKR